ncbi:MAG: Thiol-disulfide oxidoreductase ResA [Calditrichaeota bacterium]|nr:Thiol-disulfide oxidoreductase ResA [Calditrichota bacterium]
MMDRNAAVRLAGLTVAAGLIAGCAIEQTEVEPVGAIRVTAMDTTQGFALEQAQVLVNSVPRSQTVPAVLGELPPGEVTVTLRPGQGYPPATRVVTVDPPETTQVHFLYARPDNSQANNASVKVVSNLPDATVIIDEQLQSERPPDEYSLLPPGDYTLSLHKPGHRTLPPALRSESLEAGEFYTFQFELEQGTVSTEVGSLFPDFTLPDDWGGEHSLGQFRGRIVLLTFWFYDCQPCRDEFPSIEQVFQERAGDGFRVLGVNVGWYQDDQEDFEAIREQLGLTFPLLFNTNGPEWTRFDLGIEQAPANFIVGPTGEIHFRRGQISYELLNEMIDDVLGG